VNIFIFDSTDLITKCACVLYCGVSPGYFAKAQSAKQPYIVRKLESIWASKSPSVAETGSHEQMFDGHPMLLSRGMMMVTADRNRSTISHCGMCRTISINSLLYLMSFCDSFANGLDKLKIQCIVPLEHQKAMERIKHPFKLEIGAGIMFSDRSCKTAKMRFMRMIISKND
jgi:hypothetical protein